MHAFVLPLKLLFSVIFQNIMNGFDRLQNGNWSFTWYRFRLHFAKIFQIVLGCRWKRNRKRKIYQTKSFYRLPFIIITTLKRKWTVGTSRCKNNRDNYSKALGFFFSEIVSLLIWSVLHLRLLIKSNISNNK